MIHKDINFRISGHYIIGNQQPPQFIVRNVKPPISETVGDRSPNPPIGRRHWDSHGPISSLCFDWSLSLELTAFFYSLLVTST